MVRRLSLGRSDLEALGAEAARDIREFRAQSLPRGAQMLDLTVWPTNDPTLFAFAWAGPTSDLTTIGAAQVEHGTLVLRSLAIRPRNTRSRPEIDSMTLRAIHTDALRATIVAICSADERLAQQWSGYGSVRQRQAARAGSQARWRRGRPDSKPGPKPADDAVWQERANAFLDDQGQHGARGYAKRLAARSKVNHRTVQGWKQTAKQKGLLTGTGAVVAPGPRLERRAGA
jgi:hypothetical protein